MTTAVLREKMCLFSKAGVLFLCLILMLAGCNMLSGGSGSGDDPSTPSSDNEDLQLLQNLGMTNLSTDEERSEDVDNPLGSTTSNMNKTDEIFLISGCNNTIGLYNYSAADTASALSGFDTSAFSSTADLIKRPVAADTDGDGKEEVITAVFSLDANQISFYRVTDGDSQESESAGSITWSRSQDYYSTDVTDLNNNRDNKNNNYRWSHNVDIAAGDIDGDEKDEILIASEGTLYVLNEDLGQEDTKTFSPADGSSEYNQILRVACGDLNRDGIDEIVVANGSYDTAIIAEYSILTSDSSGALETVVNGKQITSDGYSLRSAEVALGDVTGDGIGDIVFGGGETDNRENCTLVAQVTTSGDNYYSDFLTTSWTDSYKSEVQRRDDGWDWGQLRARDASVPILAVGDLNFDGTAEIVSGDDILTVADEELEIFSDSGDNLLRTGVVDSNLPGYWYWGYKASDTAYLSQVKVGDLTGDGCAEIAVIDFTRSYLRIYRYNANTQDMDYIGEKITGGFGSSPYLCLPDIDEDGLVLRYVDHSLEYSEPFVLAVLAAPPYWNLTDGNGDPIQNYDGNGTAVSIEEGVSAGTSFSLSMSNSMTLGGTVEVPVISNGEVEITRTLTRTVSTAFDVSAEMSMEYELASDPTADYVVFSACPVDVYIYEVVQVEPGNEDDLEVGDYVNMTYARDACTNMTTVDFYNENNGTYEDIDDTVLSHTVGNPNTYLSQDEADDGIIRTNPLSYLLENVNKGLVPQGGATNTISYSNSVSTDLSFSCEIEVSESRQVSFIALVGTEDSISVGFSVSVGATIGSGISGTVGGLNDPYYGDPDYMYNWGIYSYFHDSDDSVLPYTVVNYWVD